MWWFWLLALAGCASDPVVLGSAQVPCRNHGTGEWVTMADDVSIEAVWTPSWYVPTGGDLPGEGTSRPADRRFVRYVESTRAIEMRCPDETTVLWLTWVDATGY